MESYSFASPLLGRTKAKTGGLAHEVLPNLGMMQWVAAVLSVSYIHNSRRDILFFFFLFFVKMKILYSESSPYAAAVGSSVQCTIHNHVAVVFP